MTDPDAYFTETHQSMQEAIELTELGFTFAVENIPKNLGKIELHQVTWNGVNGVKTQTQIPLEPCESLTPYDLPIANKYARARLGKNDANT